MIAAGLLESGIYTLPRRKMRIFKKMSQERQVYREDERECFPPSPEEPGVNGNLQLPELTVGKFFVGIKKLGEKKKKNYLQATILFSASTINTPELFFQIPLPDQMPLKLKCHISHDLVPLGNYTWF